MNHPPYLSPESAFSREVYKRVRPAIPRAMWPDEFLRASFVVTADGLCLDATFDGFPPPYDGVAARMVREAKVDLVLESPVAGIAVLTYRVRRWRDAFLYAALPLLFAVPLMTAGLGGKAMQISWALFGIDTVALLFSHLALMARRSGLNDARFVAHIPVPGMRLRVPTGTRHT